MNVRGRAGWRPLLHHDLSPLTTGALFIPSITLLGDQRPSRGIQELRPNHLSLRSRHRSISNDRLFPRRYYSLHETQECVPLSFYQRRFQSTIEKSRRVSQRSLPTTARPAKIRTPSPLLATRVDPNSLTWGADYTDQISLFTHLAAGNAGSLRNVLPFHGLVKTLILDVPPAYTVRLTSSDSNHFAAFFIQH